MQILEEDLIKIVDLPDCRLSFETLSEVTLIRPNGKKIRIDICEYKEEIENYYNIKLRDDFHYDVADYDNCIYVEEIFEE